MNVFHVKVVGCDCIGYGVLGKNLGLFHRIPGDKFSGKKEWGVGPESEHTESLTLGQVPEGGNQASPLSQPSNLDYPVEGTSLV